MQWQWENATAGAIAGFTTVAALHPLDVVRTRFQVNDGRLTRFPLYTNTANALYTIARTEGLRGLYSGFFPAVLGSSLSWGLYFFFYSRAKHRYQKDTGEQLGPGLHLASAAEAGTLVCLFTNPVWLVKTRLQLQVPGSAAHQPYSGFFDASRTIFRDEGWRALYKGLGPGLLLVSHGAIQFTAYEEARKFVIKSRNKQCNDGNIHGDEVLTSADYVAMGAFSKIFAALSTYPYQVIRARVQQRPNSEGVPKYRDSYHALTETLRDRVPGTLSLCFRFRVVDLKGYVDCTKALFQIY
ncbi:folate transporter 1, chloroplastic isoform X2 [Cryptomeria japonica]|uniref:folate transporter 1, chloroplastic isoform X2 n=1 Tax=Cryptomeria japonica TaxID=3369 RepID=UPI0027DA9810|nr:folate transporter 1, chloroplastic isoform X2 [Cryptomeria japonica]